MMRLLLGVTGGIAAYKACDLTSLAVKAGHEVRVVMTESAARFVGPLSFEGLCGTPPMVGTEHLDPGAAMNHIQWAKWAQVCCVAPLTANSLARMAGGFADDALSTLLLALPARVPVVLGPAMNTEMWNHPAVQANMDKVLKTGRAYLVEPVRKRLACGDIGPGALANPETLLAECIRLHRELEGTPRVVLG
jgi:phosphopantothenoylcysteine decarboxylase/phosphopantothenate--cysteine ligase